MIFNNINSKSLKKINRLSQNYADLFCEIYSLPKVRVIFSKEKGLYPDDIAYIIEPKGKKVYYKIKVHSPITKNFTKILKDHLLYHLAYHAKKDISDGNGRLRELEENLEEIIKNM